MRVDAQHFVCGLVFQDDICIQAATLLHWMVGMDAGVARQVVEKNGWAYQWLDDPLCQHWSKA